MNTSKLMLIIFLSLWMLQTGYALPNKDVIFKKTSNEILQLLHKSEPLDGNALQKLVSANTIVGHGCHQHDVYELFFKKNGTVIFRKARDNNQIYYGKWWIKGNTICSQWKTYHHKPTVNKMHYYHVLENVYVEYRLNESCGTTHSFGHPLMVFQGNPFQLPDE